MGSDLGVIGKDGTARVLWFNPRAHQRWIGDASTPARRFVPAARDRRGRSVEAVLFAIADDAEPAMADVVWPFDWRQDITLTADLLQQDLDGTSGKVVHLVAHSMGGLVCNTWIARHPEDSGSDRRPADHAGNAARSSLPRPLAGDHRRGSQAAELSALRRPTLKKRDISVIVGYVRRPGADAALAGMEDWIPTSRSCIQRATGGATR